MRRIGRGRGEERWEEKEGKEQKIDWEGRKIRRRDEGEEKNGRGKEGEIDWE